MTIELADGPPLPVLTPTGVALKSCCPRCGQGRLFRAGPWDGSLGGLIEFAPRCRVCGLDFSQFNVGDGAASFLILIIGAIVVGLAVWLELSRSPPWYVHVALWLPLSLVLTLGLLRFAKALLLAIEYQQAAREGRS